MPLKNEERGKLISAYFGRRELVAPTNLYVGLSSTQPLSDGTGITEPTISASTGYYRVQLPNVPESFSIPTSANSWFTSNVNPIEFSETQVNLGTVGYYFISDQPTGGLALAYGALPSVVSLGQYTTVRINAGDLKFSISNP